MSIITCSETVHLNTTPTVLQINEAQSKLVQLAWQHIPHRISERFDVKRLLISLEKYSNHCILSIHYIEGFSAKDFSASIPRKEVNEEYIRRLFHSILTPYQSSEYLTLDLRGLQEKINSHHGTMKAEQVCGYIAICEQVLEAENLFSIASECLSSPLKENNYFLHAINNQPFMPLSNLLSPQALELCKTTCLKPLSMHQNNMPILVKLTELRKDIRRGCIYITKYTQKSKTNTNYSTENLPTPPKSTLTMSSIDKLELVQIKAVHQLMNTTKSDHNPFVTKIRSICDQQEVEDISKMSLIPISSSPSRLNLLLAINKLMNNNITSNKIGWNILLPCLLHNTNNTGSNSFYCTLIQINSNVIQNILDHFLFNQHSRFFGSTSYVCALLMKKHYLTNIVEDTPENLIPQLQSTNPNICTERLKLLRGCILWFQVQQSYSGEFLTQGTMTFSKLLEIFHNRKKDNRFSFEKTEVPLAYILNEKQSPAIIKLDRLISALAELNKQELTSDPAFKKIHELTSNTGNIPSTSNVIEHMPATSATTHPSPKTISIKPKEVYNFSLNQHPMAFRGLRKSGLSKETVTEFINYTTIATPKQQAKALPIVFSTTDTLVAHPQNSTAQTFNQYHSTNAAINPEQQFTPHPNTFEQPSNQSMDVMQSSKENTQTSPSTTLPCATPNTQRVPHDTNASDTTNPPQTISLSFREIHNSLCKTTAKTTTPIPAQLTNNAANTNNNQALNWPVHHQAQLPSPQDLPHLGTAFTNPLLELQPFNQFDRANALTLPMHSTYYPTNMLAQTSSTTNITPWTTCDPIGEANSSNTTTLKRTHSFTKIYECCIEAENEFNASKSLKTTSNHSTANTNDSLNLNTHFEDQQALPHFSYTLAPLSQKKSLADYLPKKTNYPYSTFNPMRSGMPIQGNAFETVYPPLKQRRFLTDNEVPYNNSSDNINKPN